MLQYIYPVFPCQSPLTIGPKTEDLCRLCQGGWERGTPSAQVRSRPHRVPGFQYQMGVQTRKMARGSTWCQEGKKVDSSQAGYGFAPWLHQTPVQPQMVRGWTFHQQWGYCSWPQQAQVDSRSWAPRWWGGKAVFHHDQLGHVECNRSAASYETGDGGMHRPSWLGRVCEGIPNFTPSVHIKCRSDNASSAQASKIF